MSVGKAVLRVRLEQGLTQKEVGRRARLATSYISRIENGRIQPTMVTLSRLASALQVSTSEIFRTAEDPLPATGHPCPVSSSGTCIGELIRSRKGSAPKGEGLEVAYGPDEIHLLRMADYIINHGTSDLRRALQVLLESLVNQASQKTP